ncbi:MAG: 50S ribosomal protein L6 [Gammaproteobacteria bacterium]|nr:50S ribosomal protein L6 [Gammaproteobacteria bacterium]MDH5659739.1 50S ribosomal protein L6 [Gammaproteobacteria bacterium]
MARLSPLEIPKGVEVSVKDREVNVKGSKGTMEHKLHASVDIKNEDNVLTFIPGEGVSGAAAQAGTARSLINSMMIGVSEGFEKKLELVGVGYRAQAQGKAVNLTLGFSHPVSYELPEGITAETPTQTEIVIRGINKQVVGQVAADIRAYRPPEPYKGKGVKYAGEHIVRKEAKKK